MFDDLSQVKRRYEELAYRMTTPEAMNDPAAYAAMMREYKELTPLVEAYRSYTALKKEVDEEKALLDALRLALQPTAQSTGASDAV